jgi:hypothetical protein
LCFQLLQPRKRRAGTVLELGDHCRRRFIVLLRSQTLRFLGCEHLPASARSATAPVSHAAQQMRCEEGRVPESKCADEIA